MMSEIWTLYQSLVAAPAVASEPNWTPTTVISLVSSLGALAAVGGLLLLPKTRRKIISDTGVSDATQAKMYSEMGMAALKAALEEAKAEVTDLKTKLESVSAQAETERRLSNARINQLLDDLREHEMLAQVLKLEIVRLGGTPPTA